MALPFRDESTRETVTFASIFLVLCVFPLFDLLAPELARIVGTVVPAWLPGAVVLDRAWFWVVLAMVVVGVGYARAGPTELPFGSPAVGSRSVLLIVVLVPILVAAALFGLLHLVLGRSVATVAGVAWIPAPTPGFLWWNAVVPGLLIGIGYGFLFYGAIQERLRTVVGPPDAVLAVAVLAGLYHWVVDPVWRLTRSNLLLLVALALTVGTTVAVLDLSRIDDASLAGALSPRLVAALCLAGLFAFVVSVNVLSGATSVAELALAGAWLVVLGVGAWGYERTRSVWVPAVTIAGFQTLVLAVPSVLAATGGLAPGPA